MSDTDDRDRAQSDGPGHTPDHSPEHSMDRFEPLLGDAFEIGDGSGTLPVTLVEVTSLREAQGAGRRSQQFSLVWRGPPGATLPQKIYTVTHPQLGAMDLFLVTIGPDAEGMRYEAVFT